MYLITVSHWHQFKGSFSCSHLQERTFLPRLQLIPMLSNFSTFSTLYILCTKSCLFHLFSSQFQYAGLQPQGNKKTFLCIQTSPSLHYDKTIAAFWFALFIYSQGSVSFVLVHDRDCQFSVLCKLSSLLFCLWISDKLFLHRIFQIFLKILSLFFFFLMRNSDLLVNTYTSMSCKKKKFPKFHLTLSFYLYLYKSDVYQVSEKHATFSLVIL